MTRSGVLNFLVTYQNLEIDGGIYKNTLNFDEHLFWKAALTLGTFDTCAAPFEENTSRNRKSVGSACPVVGRPVQARRANVQARRAVNGGPCKFSPRHVAQCRNVQTVAILTRISLFWC